MKKTNNDVTELQQVNGGADGGHDSQWTCDSCHQTTRACDWDVWHEGSTCDYTTYGKCPKCGAVKKI